MAKGQISEVEIALTTGPHQFAGTLALPSVRRGMVLFAHGSGSSRHSPRNRLVAAALNHAGLATLLMDLLEESEAADRSKVFDVELLADRVVAAMTWLRRNRETAGLQLGLFGASTGAAAVLIAAARRPQDVRAIVSRGGRPDLATDYLSAVRAPTLLIVGSLDEQVLQLNEWAASQLRCESEVAIVPGASHLFPESGALEEVAALAQRWFLKFLAHEAPEEVARFSDREDAGRRLAQQLRARDLVDPLVLAIPRGGVVTGAALARELGAELDVVLARKLRAPGHAELAMGALSEEGQITWNSRVTAEVAIPAEYAQREVAHQSAEIERRRRLIRAIRPAAAMGGRSVIVTDDGIATGATLAAALQVVRHHHPRELIVAVPVAPPAAVQLLKREGIEVVCLLTPLDFHAVGEFYEDFTPVEDDTVLALLRASQAPSSP